MDPLFLQHTSSLSVIDPLPESREVSQTSQYHCGLAKVRACAQYQDSVSSHDWMVAKIGYRSLSLNSVATSMRRVPACHCFSRTTLQYLSSQSSHPCVQMINMRNKTLKLLASYALDGKTDLHSNNKHNCRCRVSEAFVVEHRTRLLPL